MLNCSNKAKRLMMLIAAASVCFTTQPAKAEAVREEQVNLGQKLDVPLSHWTDSAVPTKGIIFAIHGVTLYANRFNHIANQLATNGYQTYAMDIRGYGRWRTEKEKFTSDGKIHYTQAQDELISVLKAVKEANPNLPVYLMGESLGANLAVWVASTNPELTNGIILSSPCIKRIVHLKPRVFIDAGKGLFRPYHEMKLDPYIEPYLSEDPRVTKGYLSDTSIHKHLSPADLIKSVKTNTLTLQHTQKIPADLPVLVIAGKKDKIYSAKAIPKFAEKLPCKEKAVYILEDRGHLLLEHDFVAPDVMAHIDTWLVERSNESVLNKASAEITNN
jgi:acylglycerol lipase